MTLMTVCNGKSPEAISDFYIIIICEIIYNALDDKILNGSVNSSIDVDSLYIRENCRPNGCWLKKFHTRN